MAQLIRTCKHKSLFVLLKRRSEGDFCRRSHPRDSAFWCAFLFRSQPLYEFSINIRKNGRFYGVILKTYAVSHRPVWLTRSWIFRQEGVHGWQRLACLVVTLDLCGNMSVHFWAESKMRRTAALMSVHYMRSYSRKPVSLARCINSSLWLHVWFLSDCFGWEAFCWLFVLFLHIVQVEYSAFIRWTSEAAVGGFCLGRVGKKAKCISHVLSCWVGETVETLTKAKKKNLSKPHLQNRWMHTVYTAASLLRSATRCTLAFLDWLIHVQRSLMLKCHSHVNTNKIAIMIILKGYSADANSGCVLYANISHHSPVRLSVPHANGSSYRSGSVVGLRGCVLCGDH